MVSFVLEACPLILYDYVLNKRFYLAYSGSEAVHYTKQSVDIVISHQRTTHHISYGKCEWSHTCDIASEGSLG